MKTILLSFFLFVAILPFAQEFRYDFKVEGISEPASAKLTIANLRDILGVMLVRFDDDVDLFIILTQLDFEVDEMITKLGINGVVVAGLITKVNVE